MGEDTRNGIFDIHLPDPETESWSWARAEALIDEKIGRVFEAIGGGDTAVLSVFAIGPIPVLIYLGSRLDDKTETVLYRRQRNDHVGAGLAGGGAWNRSSCIYRWSDDEAPRLRGCRCGRGRCPRKFECSSEPRANSGRTR